MFPSIKIFCCFHAFCYINCRNRKKQERKQQVEALRFIIIPVLKKLHTDCKNALMSVHAITLFKLHFYFTARSLHTNCPHCKALNLLFSIIYSSCTVPRVGCSVWKLLRWNALSLSFFCLRPYLSSLFCSSITECEETRRIDRDAFLSLRPFKVREEGGREGGNALFLFVTVAFSWRKLSFELRSV